MINVSYCDLEKEITKAIGNCDIVTHGKNKYFRIGAGFDCETTKTEKGYAFVYIWQFSINDSVFFCRKIEKIITFINILDKCLVKRYYKMRKSKPKEFPQILVYIAYAGYEWSFFKYFFNKIGIRSVFAKKPREPLCIKVGKCIEFRECLGLWGVSLDNIAKNYTKTQKMVGDIDYILSRNSKTFLTNKELKYCENDVRVLSELGLLTFEKFKGIKIPYTQTGIIRNEVQRRIMKSGRFGLENAKEAVKKLYPRNVIEYQNAMHKLFCGGLTHSNYKYVNKTLRNVQCADLTSDYPAQMAHHTFPAGTMYENCTIEDMKKYPHWYALFTFENVTNINGHTIISGHKLISCDSEFVTVDNGRVYSAKKMSVYLNEIDYENFCKFYDFKNVSICDIHCFSKSEKIPKELFDVLFEQYKVKSLLKESGKTDTIEYVESKKIVNGCFGFTATRIYLTDVILENGDLKEQKTDKTYDELTKNIWLSPWIAVYTTSYARAILCDIISRFPDCVVQYDTDSIYFLTEHKDTSKLLKYIKEYNKEIEIRNREIFDDPLYYDLGKWDIEKISEKFKCIGAKRYLKQTQGRVKLVCAGAKSKAFIKYCDEKGLDYFETFTKDMLLQEGDSMKTTMKYYPPTGKTIDPENPYEDTITDYQGHTEKVKIYSCGVVTDIPFKLKVKSDWLNGDFIKLAETLNDNEKRL